MLKTIRVYEGSPFYVRGAKITPQDIRGDRIRLRVSTGMDRLVDLTCMSTVKIVPGVTMRLGSREPGQSWLEANLDLMCHPDTEIDVPDPERRARTGSDRDQGVSR